MIQLKKALFSLLLAGILIPVYIILSGSQVKYVHEFDIPKKIPADKDSIFAEVGSIESPRKTLQSFDKNPMKGDFGDETIDDKYLLDDEDNDDLEKNTDDYVDNKDDNVDDTDDEEDAHANEEEEEKNNGDEKRQSTMMDDTEDDKEDDTNIQDEEMKDYDADDDKSSISPHKDDDKIDDENDDDDDDDDDDRMEDKEDQTNVNDDENMIQNFQATPFVDDKTPEKEFETTEKRKELDSQRSTIITKQQQTSPSDMHEYQGKFQSDVSEHSDKAKDFNKKSDPDFRRYRIPILPDVKLPAKGIVNSTLRRIPIDVMKIPIDPTPASNYQIFPTDKKIILIFVRKWYIPILKRVNFNECEVKKCILTQDNMTYRKASVVIFNHFQIKGRPPPKLKDQIWIFHSEEPPFYTNTRYPPEWDGQFNYTMTYRRDSDFLDAFGRLEKRTTALERNYDAIYDAKEGEVVIFESNCRAPSRRQEYIKELMRFIQVDVYGKCGKFKCGRSDFYSTDKCHEEVSNKYKFYLVFENSICHDYTTEKFYHIFGKNYPIIPVVRGAPNILDYTPSHLFINTYDFENPRDLAMHLKHIGSDRRRYIDFLRTMDQYSSPRHHDIFQESMCKLCSLLHSPVQQSRTVRVSKWTWSKQCPIVKPAGFIDERLRKKTN